MSESNRQPTDKVWDQYIEEPFRSRVTEQHDPPQVTEKSVLVVIDLYNLVYEGGDRPVSELIDQFPASCGEFAYRAIEPTNKLIALFREKAVSSSRPRISTVLRNGNATHRPRNKPKLADYEIIMINRETDTDHS